MFWWWSLCHWCVSPLLFFLNVNRLAYGYKRWRLPANEACRLKHRTIRVQNPKKAPRR
jgi:hypothetical protein